MTFGKPIAALLILGGLVAGTLGPSPQSTPRQAGGYWILAADFHVHGFIGDGAFAPWTLRREASRAGLDAFALTNHNQVFTARWGRWLAARSPGPILLAGQEITASGYHVIAAGISRRVDAEQSAAAAIEDVHRQGGVAIAAHPMKRVYTNGYDERALSLLDGVERAHPSIYEDPAAAGGLEAFHARVSRLNPGVGAIGSSDFHSSDWPGRCRTYVLARERSERGVIDAVRDGRTVAADAEGRLYGDPQFVRIVEEAGGFVAPPAADRGRSLSVWAVWLGLLGLIVLKS